MKLINTILNNANLSAGSFDLNYLNSYSTETIDINGLEVISEFAATGETFQFTITFFENGTYIANGQYVVIQTTTVVRTNYRGRYIY